MRRKRERGRVSLERAGQRRRERDPSTIPLTNTEKQEREIR
jgi:hypothetical protein